MKLYHLIFLCYLIYGLIFNNYFPKYMKPDENFHYSRVMQLSQFKNPCDESTENSQCIQPIVAHIPYAVLVSIGNTFKVNQENIYYLARATYFYFSLIMMYFLLYKSKYYFRFIIIFTFFLPVAMQQLTAYSYDGAQILLGSLLCYLLLTNNRISVISNKSLIIFGILLTLFLSVKNGWEFFILLWFVLPIKKIGIKRTIVGFMILLITNILIKVPYFLAATSRSTEIFANYPEFSNSSAQLLIVFDSPIFFLKNLVVASMLHGGFYINGAIGLLGDMTYSIPTYLYLLIFLLLIFVIKLQKKNEISFSDQQIFFLSIVLFFNYLWFQLLQYLTWTPVGQPDIFGTLGRYFIVFIPFMIILMLNIHFKYSRGLYIFTFVFLLFYFSWVIYKYSFNHDDGKPDHISSSGNNIDIRAARFLTKTTNPNRSMSGIDLIFEYSESTAISYKLLIYKDGCRDIISSQFLDYSRVNSNPYRIKLKPLYTSKLCLSIFPLDTNQHSNVKLIELDTGSYFEPVY